MAYTYLPILGLQASAAKISVCGGISTTTLTPGSEVIITCGSVTEQIVSGPISISFTGQSSDCLATTTIESGNTLTFYADTCTFTAPSTNPDTVIVTVGILPKSQLDLVQIYGP